MPTPETPEPPSPGPPAGPVAADPRADRIARLAARALGAPAAALWVPRGGGLHLAAGHGLEGLSLRVDELPVEVDRPSLVVDVATEPRPDEDSGDWFSMPGVAPPSVRLPIRGCAVAPVNDPSGRRLGVLAVLDVVPRLWTATDAYLLEEHAGLLGEVIRAR